MRKKTEEMGLDPNRWFGNVELAALDMVGQETVRYVSNIYKYYITYKLLRRARDAKNTTLNASGKAN
jgi:membrane-bound lytic murein transglycosylase MltF